MKYPTGINKEYKQKTSHSKRGMKLEKDINDTNEFYLASNIAVIHKKPTPITLVKVSYPSRNKAIIKEAYFNTPSTTDYNGIYKGKYIDFEAKETSGKSFPLSNIHDHQIKHLKQIDNHGGIGFIIVRFTKLNLNYYLGIKEFLNFTENNGKKSIPLEYFTEFGYKIKDTYNPRIDYLKIVDYLYFGGKYD